MATQQQNVNLRRVLQSVIGPIAVLLSDQQIEEWRTGFQNDLDKGVIMDWSIQTRLVGDNSFWKDIERGDVFTCSIYEAKRKAVRLCNKYDEISDILLSGQDDTESVAFLVSVNSIMKV